MTSLQAEFFTPSQKCGNESEYQRRQQGNQVRMANMERMRQAHVQKVRAKQGGNAPCAPECGDTMDFSTFDTEDFDPCVHGTSVEERGSAPCGSGPPSSPTLSPQAEFYTPSQKCGNESEYQRRQQGNQMRMANMERMRQAHVQRVRGRQEGKAACAPCQAESVVQPSPQANMEPVRRRRRRQRCPQRQGAETPPGRPVGMRGGIRQGFAQRMEAEALETTPMGMSGSTRQRFAQGMEDETPQTPRGFSPCGPGQPSSPMVSPQAEFYTPSQKCGSESAYQQRQQSNQVRMANMERMRQAHVQRVRGRQGDQTPCAPQQQSSGSMDYTTDESDCIAYDDSCFASDVEHVSRLNWSDELMNEKLRRKPEIRKGMGPERPPQPAPCSPGSQERRAREDREYVAKCMFGVKEVEDVKDLNLSCSPQRPQEEDLPWGLTSRAERVCDRKGSNKRVFNVPRRWKYRRPPSSPMCGVPPPGRGPAPSPPQDFGTPLAGNQDCSPSPPCPSPCPSSPASPCPSSAAAPCPSSPQRAICGPPPLSSPQFPSSWEVSSREFFSTISEPSEYDYPLGSGSGASDECEDSLDFSNIGYDDFDPGEHGTFAEEQFSSADSGGYDQAVSQADCFGAFSSADSGGFEGDLTGYMDFSQHHHAPDRSSAFADPSIPGFNQFPDSTSESSAFSQFADSTCPSESYGLNQFSDSSCPAPGPPDSSVCDQGPADFSGFGDLSMPDFNQCPDSPCPSDSFGMDQFPDSTCPPEPYGMDQFADASCPIPSSFDASECDDQFMPDMSSGAGDVCAGNMTEEISRADSSDFGQSSYDCTDESMGHSPSFGGASSGFGQTMGGDCGGAFTGQDDESMWQLPPPKTAEQEDLEFEAKHFYGVEEVSDADVSKLPICLSPTPARPSYLPSDITQRAHQVQRNARTNRRLFYVPDDWNIPYNQDDSYESGPLYSPPQKAIEGRCPQRRAPPRRPPPQRRAPAARPCPPQRGQARAQPPPRRAPPSRPCPQPRPPPQRRAPPPRPCPPPRAQPRPQQRAPPSRPCPPRAQARPQQRAPPSRPCPPRAQARPQQRAQPCPPQRAQPRPPQRAPPCPQQRAAPAQRCPRGSSDMNLHQQKHADRIRRAREQRAGGAQPCPPRRAQPCPQPRVQSRAQPCPRPRAPPPQRCPQTVARGSSYMNLPQQQHADRIRRAREQRACGPAQQYPPMRSAPCAPARVQSRRQCPPPRPPPTQRQCPQPGAGGSYMNLAQQQHADRIRRARENRACPWG